MRTAATAGPRHSSLLILLAAAMALLATSAPIPSLDGHVRGEVALTGGETVTRQVRLHLERAGGAGATDGAVSVRFVAANGLDDGDGIGTTLMIAPEGGQADGSGVSAAIPVDQCLEGCDRTYLVTVTAGPDVLPGSTMRYDVDALVRYAGGSSFRDPALMRLDVDGRADTPPPALWAVLAGLLAITLGILVGRRTAEELGASRRRWTALALAALPVAFVVVPAVTRAIQLADFLASGRARLDPSFVGYVVDPWSTVLLLTLAWGVIRGIRRWPDDGGWSLGLGAVALVGLGGLWLAFVSTDGSVFQPWLYAAGAAAMGLLGGIVIGDAWRPNEDVRRDRGWAATAVLSHGILIAGFGFLSVQWLYDPFGGSPTALLGLIPAALLALSLRRWFRGARRWLLLFDGVIVAIGLLGSWFWFGASTSFGPSDGFRLDDLGIVIALVASMIAFVTALHAMRPPPPAIPAGAGAVSPGGPSVADPATT